MYLSVLQKRPPTHRTRPCKGSSETTKNSTVSFRFNQNDQAARVLATERLGYLFVFLISVAHPSIASPLVPTSIGSCLPSIPLVSSKKA